MKIEINLLYKRKLIGNFIAVTALFVQHGQG